MGVQKEQILFYRPRGQTSGSLWESGTQLIMLVWTGLRHDDR